LDLSLRILSAYGGGSCGIRIGTRTRGRKFILLPGENEQARKMALDDGESLVWENDCQGHNDALRKMYVFRGWGEYRPMLREDGSPFPEDEDDDFYEI
jgi:hypothetical protein